MSIGKFKGFLIWTLMAIILSSGFLSILGINTAQAQTLDWNQTGLEIEGHNFSRVDNNIKDILNIRTSEGSIEIEYTNGNAIDFWDFFDPENYPPLIAPLQWERLQEYAKRTYSIYPLPGLETFFLIVDNSTDKVKGIFKKMDGQCENLDQQPVDCQWDYYLAYASYSGYVVTKEGEESVVKLSYNHSASDKETLRYQYITSVNSTKPFLQGGDCAKPGSELRPEEYEKCFFPVGGHFQNLKVKDNGNNPPTILIPGKSDFDQNKYPGAKRPDLTFTLSHVLQSTGLARANYFYFVATTPSYPNLSIRIKNCDPSRQDFIVIDVTEESLLWNKKIPQNPIVSINEQSLYDNLINKVYGGGTYTAGNCPKFNEIDDSSDGQLAKWGVSVLNRQEGSSAIEDDTCGVTEGNIVTKSIAKVLCSILDGIGKLGKWLIETLKIDEVIKARSHPSHKLVNIDSLNIFAISNASAAETPSESSIKRALDGDPPWVLDAWRIVLGLANVFVVVVLLFLAVTNILRIQYDTYAIKKALPTLIIGIILANFSVLITKMLVDAANVLTATFTGTDAGTMIQEVINAVVPEETGQSAFKGTNNIGSLLLAVIFGFVAILGFLLLGFLLYIRYIVILALTMVAPLAFVLMAFPPTQGIFKQWWGWFAKFIFMKPVAIFLVYLAWQVVTAGGVGGGLTVWVIATFLIYAAVLVPLKMGGLIMGAWAGFGKKVAGGVGRAGKAGLSKGTEVQRAKLSNWYAKTRLGRFQAGRQQELDTLKKEGETTMARHQREIDEKKGGLYALRRKEISNEEKLGKTQEAQFLHRMHEGTLDTLSESTLEKYTGVSTPTGLKKKYIDIDHQLDQAERALKKRGEIDLAIQAINAMTNHMNLMANIKGKTATTDQDGEEVDYDKAKTALSNLRNLIQTEDDPGKISDYQSNIDRMTGDIQNFEQQQVKLDPNINFANYLDKNNYGRMQARVNPMLAEEMDVILKSESIEQITDSIENGGGTSEFRFTKEDSKNYLTGNIEKVSIPARYGIQAYMMALQGKIRMAGGIDQQEAVSGALRIFEEMSPGAKQQLIQSVKQQMSPEMVSEFEGDIGKTIDEIDAEDIMRLDISKYGSKSRDFLRRMALEISQHPALGAAGSPGSFVGKATNAQTPKLASDLMSTNPQNSKQVQNLASSALGGAQALTGTTPEVTEITGDIAQRAINQVVKSGANQVVVSLETDVISRLNPSSVTIDDSALKKQIIDAVSESVDINDLNQRIQGINPQLRADFRAEILPEIKFNATRVRNGLENMDNLARLAIAETCLPHYNERIRQLTHEQTQQMQRDIENLTTKMRTQLESGQPFSQNDEIINSLDEFLKTLGHTKMERNNIKNKIDAFPETAIDLLRKKGLTIEAARRLKEEYQKAVKTAEEDENVKPPTQNYENDARRVNEEIKKVVNERYGATPPPPPPSQSQQQPPTAGPQPPPAAPSGPSQQPPPPPPEEPPGSPPGGGQVPE